MANILKADDVFVVVSSQPDGTLILPTCVCNLGHWMEKARPESFIEIVRTVETRTDKEMSSL